MPASDIAERGSTIPTVPPGRTAAVLAQQNALYRSVCPEPRLGNALRSAAFNWSARRLSACELDRQIRVRRLVGVYAGTAPGDGL